MGPVIFYHAQDWSLIQFEDLTEFVIGRALANNLCIPDCAISREQCVIKKVPEGEWLLVDKSSFKTTLLNGVKIPQNGIYIKSGDLISFVNRSALQLYFFTSVEDMPRNLKRERPNFENDSELSSQESRTSRSSMNGCSEPKKPRIQTTTELNDKMEELKLAREAADGIIMAMYDDLKKLQAEYEDCYDEINRLVAERNMLLEELRDYTLKREAAEDVAKTCECSESREIETALILQSVEAAELKEQLEEMKEKMAEMKEKMADMEEEMAKMNAKLADAEESATSLTLVKERLYSDAMAILEQEFLCCVCTDLLYDPVTLNCGHSICFKCLLEWKKKQKTCPTCRTVIKTETRPLIIDSFIDRIAPLLGDEFMKRRQEAKKEKWTRAEPQGVCPACPYRQGRGRRSRGRGGRGVRNSINNLPAPNEVIDLTNAALSPRHRNNR